MNSRLIDLTFELSVREIKDRYIHHALGFFWVLLHPLILISIYLFVFALVFKVKISTTFANTDYTSYLLAGLIPFMAMQTIMNRSTDAFLGNRNLLRQAVFPFEVLPLKTVIAGFVPFLITMVAYIIYLIWRQGSAEVFWLLFLGVFMLQVVFTIGIAFFIGSLAVFLRDMKEIVQVFSLISLYAMPVFYLLEQVPSKWQIFFWFNPFLPLIYCYQDVFFYQTFAHTEAWLMLPLYSIVSLFIGFTFFRKARDTFISVL